MLSILEPLSVLSEAIKFSVAGIMRLVDADSTGFKGCVIFVTAGLLMLIIAANGLVAIGTSGTESGGEDIIVGGSVEGLSTGSVLTDATNSSGVGTVSRLTPVAAPDKDRPAGPVTWLGPRNGLVSLRTGMVWCADA